MTQRKPIILFRNMGGDTKDEFEVVSGILPTTTSRTLVEPNSLVVGRYSVLPFYRELELDLKAIGSNLVNSYSQHRYVADLRNWEYDLRGLTPKTWFRLEDVPDNVGSVVLKGETNSRKNKWKTHMFAANKREAVEVYFKLADDAGLDGQDIYIREYVPLETYMVDPISGQPITEEFRIFVLRGEVVGSGYYWASHVDQLSMTLPDASKVPAEFLAKVISLVKDNVPFFVVDVAKTASGEWMVVELNDGQMSGLSCVGATPLYTRMKKVLERNLATP